MKLFIGLIGVIALLVGCATVAVDPNDPLAGIKPSTIQTITLTDGFEYLVTYKAGPVTKEDGWTLVGVVEATPQYIAFIAAKGPYRVFEVDEIGGKKVLFYILSQEGKPVEWGGNREYQTDLSLKEPKDAVS